MESAPVLPVTLLITSTKPEGLPALGSRMAEDPGHKRSLCSQEQEGGGGWGLEGPWCFCLTEGASVKGAQHGSSGTHAGFVFSPDDIQGLCRGSQRNASSASPPHPPPANPQEPHTHICMKIGPCPCGCCRASFRYIDLFSRFYGFIERGRSILTRASQNG